MLHLVFIHDGIMSEVPYRLIKNCYAIGSDKIQIYHC